MIPGDCDRLLLIRRRPLMISGQKRTIQLGFAFAHTYTVFVRSQEVSVKELNAYIPETRISEVESLGRSRAMVEESIKPAQLRSAAVPRREEAAAFQPGGGERGCSLEEGHVVEAPIASHEMEIHWGIHCTPDQTIHG